MSQYQQVTVPAWTDQCEPADRRDCTPTTSQHPHLSTDMFAALGAELRAAYAICLASIQLTRGDHEDAAAALKDAVALQSTFGISEPA